MNVVNHYSMTIAGLSETAVPALRRSRTRWGTKRRVRFVVLAFVRGGSVYTADAHARNRLGPFSDGIVWVAMAPAGNQLMVEQIVYTRYGTVTQLTVMNLDGSGYNTFWGIAYAGGWGDSQKVATKQDPNLNPVDTALCIVIVTTKHGSSCGRTVANDPSRHLFQPTLSPDGSTLAAMAVAPSHAASSTIETLDYKSGRLITDLTHGTSDRAPTWSLDGKWLAFQRGGSIYKIPASGAKPQLIVANGTQPTWGGQ